MEERNVVTKDKGSPPEKASCMSVFGLTKRFGNFAAVDGIDLDVNDGDVFGFLGPNGAGKTTTIGMILGLLKPTSGEIRLFGEPMSTRKDFRQALSKIGAMLERPAFYPYLSGFDNLRVLAGFKGKSLKRDDEIHRVLEIAGLLDSAKKKFSSYSQGMKQRLGIALALLGNPRLVVLDEPTTGLDPQGIHEVRVIIHKLSQNGITVFLSSHQLHEVEQVCSRVAVLNKGKIVARGDVRDLLRTKSRLLLRVRDMDHAKTVLSDMTELESVESRDGFLVLQLSGDHALEASEEVSRRLASQNVYPQELRVEEESLEEFFLEVTESPKSDESSAETISTHG